MGFTRFLKKAFIPGYDQIDTMKKIAKHGVVDGVKEKFREDYLEDMPITSHIYKEGKYDGKKEGYVEASDKYKDKFSKQTEKFLEQSQVFASQKEEYDKLLNDYEIYICELERKSDLSQQEKECLNKLVMMERKLVKLK